MSIWPTDPPASDLDEPYPWDEDEADVDPLGQEFPEVVDAIERADLDAATRADERLDEDDTDYDGPDWPF